MFLYATLLSLVESAERRLDRENGATAVEYGLMVGLIAIAIIAAVTLLGGKLTDLFSSVAGKLPAAS